jgi:hypothetical protein
MFLSLIDLYSKAEKPGDAPRTVPKATLEPVPQRECGQSAISRSRIIANSPTEQCGHNTFQISGFWADYGQSEPYTPFADPHRPEGAEVRS